MKRDKIIELYEIYKDLLTDKQREYFEYYYYEDLSLSEIKDNVNVSRTMINKTIKVVEEKLYSYEEKINVYKTRNEIRNILKEKDINIIKKDLEKLI